MSFSNKELDSIDEDYLQSLIDNKVLERKTLEYKEVLSGNSDAEKREFLADVSSFANAAGGDLIFGIKEVKGVPTELCGLTIANVDDKKLRLENIIRNGIKPRIPGISIREIPLQSSKVVIIIRIPRSWVLPHMVTFKNLSRFYSRNSTGKYQLDVPEIRALFALSETTTERIRNFRRGRLSNIVSGETPVALIKDRPKVILHIIPFGAFDPSVKFDISILPKRGERFGYNFDGLLKYEAFFQSLADTYLQIFRNGIIESVRVYDFEQIPSELYERELLRDLSDYLLLQKRLGIEPPLFIMLSLLDVKGYTMAITRGKTAAIDRDALPVPEIMIENIDCDPAEVMRPLFDTVWNAAGWPRSMNYNEKGEWVGQKF